MIKRTDIVVCICDLCGHVWTPKNKDIIPKVCNNPHCHSTHWNDKGEVE